MSKVTKHVCAVDRSAMVILRKERLQQGKSKYLPLHFAETGTVPTTEDSGLSQGGIKDLAASVYHLRWLAFQNAIAPIKKCNFTVHKFFSFWPIYVRKYTGNGSLS